MRQTRISVAVFGVFVMATLVTAFFLAAPLFTPTFAGDDLVLERTSDPALTAELGPLAVFESRLDAALTGPLQIFGLSVADVVLPADAYEDASSVEAVSALEAASQAQSQAISELEIPLHKSCNGLR